MLLQFKKIGNHWYPNIKHQEFEELILDPVVERLVSKFDKFGDEKVDICLIKQDMIIIQDGLLQFAEEDITRYFTTTDDFIMRFYVNNHELHLSSKLYTALERNFNFNFHKEVYRIDF